tara:strand:- start:903 stop:1082 length:180 start_codon:yes stop_codon:yes gene_type:complete
MSKLKQAQEIFRIHTIWNNIIEKIKDKLDIGSSDKDMIDDIVHNEWAKEKRNERSSSNN